MSSLVQIHKIHVDLFIGNLPVILGGQMTIRLLQCAQAVDPHLTGRKRVAPGNNARTALIIVRFFYCLADLLAAFCRNRVDQRIRQYRGQLLRHFSRPFGDSVQHFRSI